MEEGLKNAKKLPSYDELASQLFVGSCDELFEEEDSNVEIEEGEGESKEEHVTLLYERFLKPKVANEDSTVAESPEVLKAKELPSYDEIRSQLFVGSIAKLFKEHQSKLVYDVGDASPLPKHDWIERARKIWDLPDDGAIRSRIQCEKVHLSIHICGSIGEGYGAILRDCQMNPIVASCGSLSHEDSVSEFYTWLKGVALGAKIAVKYRLSKFYLYVPSEHMCCFMSNIWSPYYRGSIPLEKSFLKSMCWRVDGDIEKIFCLTSDILSDLNQLSVSGTVKNFVVQPVQSQHNRAAEFLSKLNVGQEDMKFADMFRNERLSDILYQDFAY